MATTVDTLLVRIEADMSDLKKSLNKVQRDVDKSSKGIGASFKKIGVAIKATVAAVVVQQAARAGAAVINLASDIEEMQGKSKVVFGAFRGQVVDDLEKFGDAVGRSTFELEGMASTLQDTFVPLGFARGAAADLSVQMTKLAVDVASFNNASDVETMQAFQSALVGNHETVRRFGVIITQATLDQELFRMGIAKGTKEATEAQKVQARMNLIIRGTSDAHGDAARTADSFANRSRALKAELAELGGEIGQILLPAVTKIVSALLGAAQATKAFLIQVGLLSKYSNDLSGLEMQIADQRMRIAQTQNDMDNASLMGRLLTDYQLRLDMEKRLLKTLEDRLQAQKDEAAMSNREAAANRKPVRYVPPDPLFGFDKDKANKAIMTMLEANMHATRMLELEREMTAAVKTGDSAKVRAVQLSIDKAKSDEKLMNVTEEMLETEYNLTRVQYAGLNIKDALALKSAALTAAMNDQAVAQTAATKAIQVYQGKVQDGLDYVLSNIRTNQELEETLKDLKAAYDAGKISLDEFKEAQDQIKEKINELDPVYKQMKDRANEAFDSVANSIADMVMSGSFDLKKLGGLFKQTMRQMIADALAAAVIKPILQGIFGAVGTAIGGPVGGFIGSIGASAGGGSVSPHVPEIVGERGPELIVPKSASRILNNHDTKNALGMGSSTTIVQNINISTGVQQTVRSEIRSLMPEIANSAKAAVADSKRRGGSYGRALA